MELNGTVSVDGQSGRAFTSGSGSASGGGAGGSLLVVASRLSGTGTLSADGGAGADEIRGSQGADTLKGGRHLVYPDRTPMSQLLMSLLDKCGAPLEEFSDAAGVTGTLRDL